MSTLAYVDEYHQRTKHRFNRYAASLGYMDWANQPHPFRYYEGVEVTRLELNRELPPVEYDRIYQPNSTKPSLVNLQTLSDFFYYSFALSAWKQAESSRWALRVNPSSGNLHPTEAYLLSTSVNGDEATVNLYHYVSETHVFERRASFSPDLWQSLLGHLPNGSFLVGLSSVMWREAWKYGERAFRYCQHDLGHAVAAMRISAALCGWHLKLVSNWSTDEVATLLGLDRRQDFIDEEHEEPEVLAVVIPKPTDDMYSATVSPPTKAMVDAIRSADWYGRANQLSHDHVPWSVIDEVTTATKMLRTGAPDMNPIAFHNWPQTGESPTEVDARQIIRQRRSCQALDGSSKTTLDVFLRMLGRTLPGTHPPWDALWWPPMIHLVLFVHRVDGLTPGLYALVRNPVKKDLLKQATRGTFAWEPPPGVPAGFPLYLLTEADCRDTARAVSCHQDIATDGFFSLGMIAEFAEPIRRYGAWFYRNLFWEAGMVGQVLYLEAEAAGVRSTGIGCYFDDPVHEILGLADNQFQDLYHFTVGVQVDDPRLQSSPAYPNDDV
jgi:SagB-type dehydrogenase family enzyme